MRDTLFLVVRYSCELQDQNRKQLCSTAFSSPKNLGWIKSIGTQFVQRVNRARWFN